MSTVAFTGEMARLQRANAQSHDNVVRQSKVLAALSLRTGERVLEIGCGGGYYTSDAARFVGPTGRVCAIDISPDQIRAAQERCTEFA
jgi:arsenite methyltransferase